MTRLVKYRITDGFAKAELTVRNEPTGRGVGGVG